MGFGMSLLMTLIITFINTGYDNEYFKRFLKAWSVGLPIAIIVSLVVGPIAKTVQDAALALDVLVGYTSEDPKTLASVDKTPRTSYTSDLSLDNLEGKRLGLYGPGWRPDKLSSETEELYKRSKFELKSKGAILIDLSLIHISEHTRPY